MKEDDIKKLQEKLFGEIAKGEEITGEEDIEDIILKGHPAFGGKHFRIAYNLLNKAIGENYTIFISLAGPITVSDYSRVWVIPFIKTGWISAITASDAISYHDLHDAVEGKRKIRDVNMYGDDNIHKDAEIIRITDIGFPEEVLFNTDKFVSWILTQKDFQKEMTTTEYRNLLGKYAHALETKRKIPRGLLATAFEFGVPIFCPSPADGSTFLNAMKLWVLKERLKQKLPNDSKLKINLQKDVYEFCSLHYWAQFNEGNKELAYLVCGGGATKNYLLQPEPALEQILFVPTKKYRIGIQITTAPVTDGSLSSCWPSEAISWGKLQKQAKTISIPADYTMLMSVIAHSLLKKRKNYQKKLREEFKEDKEKLFEKFPDARGFLREPLRLYEKRELTMKFLDKACKEHLNEMMNSLKLQE